MDFHVFVPRRRNHWFLGNIQTGYGLYHVLCLVQLPQRNYRLDQTSQNRKAFSLTLTQEKYSLDRKRLNIEVRANLWNAFTCSSSLGKLLSRDLFPSSPACRGWRCHSVLGIPIPISLSVLGIPFSYYCSVLGIPRYPLGMPKSLAFWASPPKQFGISRENRKPFRDGFR